MITTEQKNALLKIFGDAHIAKISKYLSENKLFNRNELPYSCSFISRVFNGAVENKNLEELIFEFAQEYPKQLEEEQERRNKIVGIA